MNLNMSYFHFIIINFTQKINFFLNSFLQKLKAFIKGMLKTACIYNMFWFIGVKILYHYLLQNVWNNTTKTDIQPAIISKPKKRKFLVLFNLTYVWIRWYMLRNLPKLIKIIKQKLRYNCTYIILKPLYTWKFLL